LLGTYNFYNRKQNVSEKKLS